MNNDPRIGIGAIVIVHHESYEPDTNGVVASTPDPAGFADVLILTGVYRGTITGCDVDLLEPCGWVTGYSSAGWPEKDA